ncbi:hypothetical protein IE81DRAFT_164170 [Ceraceosorus guamensis]|uniref:Proteasome assembly chaperone 3 n=1 Tax=Ceraceosorus guamensis TaxID=1522189 RepID=A0A316WCQ1_9BASI|nr:hypothetical protein IE81DRAFT_164170 [Ceraceosorus guamensis]PWN45643.1 hypothetical protein IE81DRAFT_164170 [Ceraceosorus guamensis]
MPASLSQSPSSNSAIATQPRWTRICTSAGLNHSDLSNVPPLDSLPTRTSTLDIQGRKTEVLAQAFEDRTLVVVTQRPGTVGYFVQATTSSPESALPLGQGTSYELDFERKEDLTTSASTHSLEDFPTPLSGTTQKILFGSTRDEEEEALYGLYLSTLAAALYKQGDARPLVLGLALSDLRSAAQQEDSTSEAELERREGERLKAVVEAVKACRVW